MAAGITQGSFKVETPQTRTQPRPSYRRRQRMLAIVAATLGMLLGGLAGAAFATQPSPSASAAALEVEDVAVGATEAAPDSATAEPVPVVLTDDLLWTENLTEEAGELALLPLIFKVSFGLGLVVLLAWGSVYLLRRTTLGQGMASSTSAVCVLDRNWLGPKKAIYLVDISGRTLALGVTEEHISVLSTWEEGQIELSRPEPRQGSFANQFKAMLHRRGDDVVARGGTS